MQEDSANDLKMLQEWFETNRVRETGIVENVQKQPASPERDEMLEICKGNIEEFTMMIQLVASIIEREKNKQLKIWEKNRPTREGCLRKICQTDIEPTQLAINPKV